MKKILLLSLLISIGTLALGQAAYAENAILSVLPASLSTAANTAFTASVQLNPANNKVCVVKGTLAFNNVTCQSITVADGVTTQKAPSCASPSFTLGIPQCATTLRNIFSASVKGTLAGQGTVSLSDVKVIGAGTDVPFTLQDGAY